MTQHYSLSPVDQHFSLSHWSALLSLSLISITLSLIDQHYFVSHWSALAASTTTPPTQASETAAQFLQGYFWLCVGACVCVCMHACVCVPQLPTIQRIRPKVLTCRSNPTPYLSPQTRLGGGDLICKLALLPPSLPPHSPPFPSLPPQPLPLYPRCRLNPPPFPSLPTQTPPHFLSSWCLNPPPSTPFVAEDVNNKLLL